MACTQELGFERLIRDALPRCSDVHEAAREVERTFRNFSPTIIDENREAFDRAIGTVEREMAEVRVLQRHSIVARRAPWYTGPGGGSRHWPAYRDYVTGSKGWASEAVKGIDEASSEIVSLLANPAEQTFGCRGLVVGYVQSGKTANMAAVIAKAVDAGYDTVLVLAGMTDKLRQQTQLRLQSDICDRRPLEWQLLTSDHAKGDFRQPANRGLLHHSDKAQLAVLKKNVGPLRQLHRTIEQTPPVVLNRLRVLLIDDECDQASVNSASGELDMTAINQKIREILKALPAVSYVGYTATPFANVLINPYSPQGDLDDLYPRDFITSLPEPVGYFGTRQLFGKPPVEADAEDEGEDGLDMIRDVPEADERALQPSSQKKRDSFQPDLASSLEDAILYFLATCAVRRARGHAGKHMTMLVHTSAYVVMHEKVAALIRGWLDTVREELVGRKGPAAERLEQVWEAESLRLPHDVTDARKVSIDEIYDDLADVLDAVEVPVENGSSEDRIDYTGKPKTYIAVGGSVLARGLTLEGLCVSYFLRTANQYDTLLQMGRWFGYRFGYEDLPRIWMPPELRQRFRALAGIEAEIRDDIAEYRRRDITPMEFATRIRVIPGMAITAANKMKNAEACDVSYWGRHVQTIRFDHRDPAVVQRNWDAASELVSLAGRFGEADDRDGRLLFRRVPRSSIVKFLRGYSVQENHRELSNDMLLGFVEQGGPMLEWWNVGVFQPRAGTPRRSSDELGSVGRVLLTNRSKLNDTGIDYADIKALMSRRDVLFDCPGDAEADEAASWERLKTLRTETVGNTPLLLLYAIDKDSEPGRKPQPENRQPPSRVALNAVADLIGFGIVFPGSRETSGKYVSVRLEVPSADEIDRLEEEEREQAEAAGA